MDIGDISTIEDGASVEEITKAIEGFKAEFAEETRDDR